MADDAIVLLLTGCIDPKGMALTSLQDSELRKVQYIDAIYFYLRSTNYNIVFAENSGVDISDLFDGHPERSRLEFITFHGNDYDKSLGKGYGEMIILEKALSDSHFIRTGKSICKITGRYQVLNIRKILKSYCKYFCDVMVDLPRQLHYGDSRIFIAKKKFLSDFLFELKNVINDTNGIYFEHALNNAVLHAIAGGQRYLPLKYRPRIVGQSGTDGFCYDHSFSGWFIANIKKKLAFRLFLDDTMYRL